MDWLATRIAIVCLASLFNLGELRAAKGDPVVRLIEPERGERRFVAPATILLEAQAQAAPQRSIVRVEFFSSEALIGATSVAPHAITWSDVPEGEYRLRVRATDNAGATDWSPFIRVRVRPNREPRVRLTEPSQDAQFNAPESIVLRAVARDRDHNLARVEFYADGVLIGTATTEPFGVSWTPVPAGDHVLIAKAIDAMGATDESRPIRIRVTGSSGVAKPKLYFIHVDHLNTPRLIADDQQRTVWTWDQQEPFGAHPPDENPSGLGRFEFSLRFPGQYFDEETNLHYNYLRDYDPSLGTYLQSDPIGLRGGLNLYDYAYDNPLVFVDPKGLEVEVGVRRFFPIRLPLVRHCFVRFNRNNSDTVSFTPSGVGLDSNPERAVFSPTIGPENDSCVREQMLRCRDYAFFANNCCDCVAYALEACGLKKAGAWPNFISAGPFRQPPAPPMCDHVQGCPFP